MAGLAPTLPFELWSTIAHFLNADVLSANFALCRAFLYAYLRMKYYTAHFGEFTSPQAFIAFKRLRLVLVSILSPNDPSEYSLWMFCFQ